MKDWGRAILVLAAAAFSSGSLALEQSPPAQSIIAFVHVNVVPMDTERVVRGQSVIVRDGKIDKLGPSLKIPPGATVFDGHGSAFLAPGLADMHTHSDSKQDMAVYLANGVTTVLNMGGPKASFVDLTVPAINSGSVPGPHIFTGFLVDGSPRYGNFVVKTPDEARALVHLLKTNRYDFIKVYNDLSPECFHALVDEGKKVGMATIGHEVTSIGVEKQLDGGQVMIAHTEEFLHSTFDFADSFGERYDPARGPPTDAEIAAAIGFIKRDGAYVTADLITYTTIAEQWGRSAAVDRYLQRPEIRYVSPDRRLAWRLADYVTRKGDIASNVVFLRRFTRDLANGGVPLIAGTDTPSVPGMFPGFSLHDGLDLLVGDGLSRFQVLSAATRIPGEFIAHSISGSEPFGKIVTGYRADLILTEGDPLQDLATLRKPLGVMTAGRWFSRPELEAMLNLVAAAYDQASVHP